MNGALRRARAARLITTQCLDSRAVLLENFFSLERMKQNLGGGIDGLKGQGAKIFSVHCPLSYVHQPEVVELLPQRLVVPDLGVLELVELRQLLLQLALLVLQLQQHHRGSGQVRSAQVNSVMTHVTGDSGLCARCF